MIDVISPLSTSLERTKQILFRPFNFEKWALIAFAAFLIQPFNGGGSSGGGGGHGGGNTTSTNSESFHDSLVQLSSFFTPLVIAICVVVFGVFLLFAIGLSFLNARGQFMLLDNIVRNRGSIAEPWRVYGAQANRLWIFNMAAACVMVLFFASLSIPLFLIIFSNGNNPIITIVYIIIIALFGLVYLAGAIVYGLFTMFGAPIMFRTGASPLEAFKRSTGLLMKDPVGILLMALVLLVMGIAIFLTVGIAIVCTLCILGCLILLPYVGSFVLLPITVFYRSYIWEILAQFGPEYNVWLEAPANPPQPAF